MLRFVKDVITRIALETDYGMDMSPLNINSEEDVEKLKIKKNRKVLRVVLGVCLLVLVPIVKTTLAAQITIANGPVQFGQGVVQAVACDDQVLVTPKSRFTNEVGAGSFSLLEVTVSGINATCDGKSFAIKVYDNAGASPLVSCTGMVYDSQFSGGDFCGDFEYSHENDTLTISMTGVDIPATDVYKITVEESDTV